jgi:hypothetical protein
LGNDVILEVCGVPAADILARCARRRGMRRTGTIPVPLPATFATGYDSSRKWSLIDLGDGTPEEFVEAVHLALLRRSPYQSERVRRMAQLNAGRTRFEIIVRIAASVEGRQVLRPAVTGVGLPVLHRLIVGLMRLARSPLIARWQQRIRRRTSVR